MNQPFITDSFLLSCTQAEELFHNYAENEPILDYHNHLSPREIAENKHFENIAQIWLGGDHYKWRLMRANGIDERYCTGDASDWEKFLAWARTVPAALRNPIYHWTHLELARHFDVYDKLLNEENAKEIWDRCNRKIEDADFCARGLLEQMKVSALCTTDDPCDSLEYHQQIAQDSEFAVNVYPAFRPDKAMAVESPDSYNTWIERLSEVCDRDIGSFASLVEALDQRHAFFHENGCRISDHGLDTVYAENYSADEVESAFAKIRSNATLDARGIVCVKSAVLYETARMDAARGWTQQLHIGALRNTRSRLFTQLGPDCGLDSIDDALLARPHARFLDRLDQSESLPKTVLYNLNPRDNYVLAAMIGSFQDGSVPGKMQFGSGWWFLDQKWGMEQQMEALSSVGLLSRFIGMLTDSRSFLSFPRHEYFRRILCTILGNDMKCGLVPNDMHLVGEMVRNISYRNAVDYFQLPSN